MNNKNETSVDESTSKTPLQRRHFLAGALTAGFIATSAAGQSLTSDTKTKQEAIFVPTPADALIDVLGYLSGIESEVLGKYYVILGEISAHIRRNYEALKKAVEDFKRLVPGIDSKSTVSRLGHLSEVGIMSASLLNQIPINRYVAGSENQVEFANAGLNELQQAIASSEIPAQSITLSPAAVAKLREILALIETLNKPTAGLDRLSGLLTQASNELRKRTAMIRPLMVDSIESLLAADFLEQPTSAEALEKVRERLKLSNKPETAIALRRRAIQNVATIRDHLNSVSSTAVPDELKEYVQKQPAPQTEPLGISVAILQHLLTAIGTWIMNPDRLTTHNGDFTGRGTTFMKIGLRSSPWPGEALARKIRGVLAELVPEANQDRLDRLWWKKVALSGQLYSEDEQYQIFFNILPRLPEFGRHDLYNDQTRREQAARKLARMTVI